MLPLQFKRLDPDTTWAWHLTCAREQEDEVQNRRKHKIGMSISPRWFSSIDLGHGQKTRIKIVQRLNKIYLRHGTEGQCRAFGQEQARGNTCNIVKSPDESELNLTRAYVGVQDIVIESEPDARDRLTQHCKKFNILTGWIHTTYRAYYTTCWREKILTRLKFLSVGLSNQRDKRSRGVRAISAPWTYKIVWTKGIPIIPQNYSYNRTLIFEFE